VSFYFAKRYEAFRFGTGFASVKGTGTVVPSPKGEGHAAICINRGVVSEQVESVAPASAERA
jgi:hypothetical protein